MWSLSSRQPMQCRVMNSETRKPPCKGPSVAAWWPSVSLGALRATWGAGRGGAEGRGAGNSRTQRVLRGGSAEEGVKGSASVLAGQFHKLRWCMLGVCRRPQGGREELALGYSECEVLERHPIGGHGFPAGPDSFLSLCAEHIRGSQKILSE